MPAIETDPSGGGWLVHPASFLDRNIADMGPAFDELQRLQPRQPYLVGLRLRLPAELGTGHWDIVKVSPRLYVLIGEVEYRRDQIVRVAFDRMLKFRVLLAGRLTQLNAGITLNGTGAFVEAFPGNVSSDYRLAGGVSTKLVILNCEPEFLIQDLAVTPLDLPSPLHHVFADAGRPAEGGLAPLGPEVLRSANDILRSSRRFQPRLLAPYLAAKSIEILCATISALSVERDSPPLAVKSSVRDVSRVNEARDILLDEFHRPPQIPQLARRVGTNQTKLKMLFRAMFGMTIHEFIQNCRMERAIDLLTTSDLTISEIAFAVGYEYPGSFAHAFRQRYGHAPRQVRRANDGQALLRSESSR